MLILSGGLGAVSREFVQGEDFKCSASVCYAIGSVNHVELIRLQKQINRFSGVAKFSPIPTDGSIGNGTLTAARRVATWVKANIAGSSSALIWTSAVADRAALTRQNMFFAGVLEGIANTKGLPVDVPAPRPTAPQPVPSDEIYVEPDSGEKSSLVWWILGGVAIVGVGTVGYVMYRQSHR